MTVTVKPSKHPLKKKNMKGVTRAVYIPSELDEKLRQLRKEKDRSYSYVVTKLLENALSDIEELSTMIQSKPVNRKRG